jgi:hypothetical protein
MSIDFTGVASVMEPEQLQDFLNEFPLVVFKAVPWVDLPVCEGCPVCDPLGGCDSTAMLRARKWLGEGYSHTTTMPVASCCLSWELRTFIRQGYEVTVEVLMIREGVAA